MIGPKGEVYSINLDIAIEKRRAVLKFDKGFAAGGLVMT